MLQKLLIIAFLSLGIMGCSMDISLEEIHPSLDLGPLESAKTTGLISGSNQRGTAIGGGVPYKVQSSVGHYMSAIEQHTDDDQYFVYSSVQGTLSSSQ